MMENPVKIVRYSHAISFPSGNVTNMQAMYGTREEVRKKAEEIAKKYGVEVKTIDRQKKKLTSANASRFTKNTNFNT